MNNVSNVKYRKSLIIWACRRIDIFLKIEIASAVRLSVSSPRALRAFHFNPSREADTLRFRLLDTAAPLDTLRSGLFEVQINIFFNRRHFQSGACPKRATASASKGAAVSKAQRVQQSFLQNPYLAIAKDSS